MCNLMFVRLTTAGGNLFNRVALKPPISCQCLRQQRRGTRRLSPQLVVTGIPGSPWNFVGLWTYASGAGAIFMHQGHMSVQESQSPNANRIPGAESDQGWLSLQMEQSSLSAEESRLEVRHPSQDVWCTTKERFSN